MSEKSISVIVMRDRGKSFSLRFSPNTFRFVLFVLFVIPLLLAGSLWFGLRFYGKYVAVLEETAVLKNTIEQNRQTVTRLANLEQFLQKYSPSMLGLLVPSENVELDELPLIDGDKEMLMSELAESIAGTAMSFDIVEPQNQTADTEKGDNPQAGPAGAQESKSAGQVSDNTAKPKNADTAENSPPENGAENKLAVSAEQTAHGSTQEQNGSSAAAAVQPADQEAFVQKIDLGYVGIENLTVKLSAKTLHINFRLLNLGKKVPVQGVHRYYICSELNGKIRRQELQNPTDSTFRIKKLKNVKSTASVMGMEIGKKAQFVVDVVVDGETVFRQFSPITS